MFKKIAIATASTALVLASVVPVFASNNNNHHQSQPFADVNIAAVDNSAESEASTGYNSQDSTYTADRGGEIEKGVGNGGDKTIRTGDAKAKSTAVVVANTEVGCSECNKQAKIEADVALVRNHAGSLADTGVNSQDQDVLADRGGEIEKGVGNGGEDKIVTGDTKSRSTAVTVVNTQISRSRPR